MITKSTRRAAIASLTVLGLTVAMALPAFAADAITLRMATSGSETDQRSIAMAGVLAPIVAGLVEYRG